MRNREKGQIPRAFGVKGLLQGANGDITLIATGLEPSSNDSKPEKPNNTPIIFAKSNP